MEEQLLIRRAKKGEMAAFEELVTLYEQRIYRLALRWSANEQDACDISQEVFLRMYRSIVSFKGESAFSTWLYRITTNVCVDFSRKSAGKTTASLDGDEETPAQQVADTNPASNPESALLNRELSEELAAALRQLSVEHRQIVLLRDVSGLSYQEIGQALELTEGTVKSRLARARKHLRDILLSRGNLLGPSASNVSEGRVTP